MSFTFDESEDVFQIKIYPSSRYGNPGRKNRRTAAKFHSWDAILHFMVKHGNQIFTKSLYIHEAWETLNLKFVFSQALSQVLTQKGHINRALLIRHVKSGRSERASIVSWFNNQSQQEMLCCSAVIYQKRHIDGLGHKSSNSRETHSKGGEETDFIEQNQGLRRFDHVTVSHILIGF
ncbi:hypothetical protein PoB_001242900 [Plakobranchus ocellatus]|uniref:Uncharacterized protein n=1 Tax=Plakobranchus ocellatus TaxID=259542 RepID=A0AAV3YV62_9GAST|nr:hypothetical protein PoB_001242900 [Plakobranchus ocellatus]